MVDEESLMEQVWTVVGAVASVLGLVVSIISLIAAFVALKTAQTAQEAAAMVRQMLTRQHTAETLRNLLQDLHEMVLHAENEDWKAVRRQAVRLAPLLAEQYGRYGDTLSVDASTPLRKAPDQIKVVGEQALALAQGQVDEIDAPTRLKQDTADVALSISKALGQVQAVVDKGG
jgi:hypothetical protein